MINCCISNQPTKSKYYIIFKPTTQSTYCCFIEIAVVIINRFGKINVLKRDFCVFNCFGDNCVLGQGQLGFKEKQWLGPTTAKG